MLNLLKVDALLFFSVGFSRFQCYLLTIPVGFLLKSVCRTGSLVFVFFFFG